MTVSTAETWQNASRGVVWVKKFDRRGDLKDEVIRAGMKFSISPEERLFNSDSAASADLDVFKNGRLVPVRLIESTEDAKEIASNPNLLSEDEMRALFKAHHKTFESKVNSITNIIALERMFAMTTEPDVDAKASQVATLKSRMAALNPIQVIERETIAPEQSSSGQLL